MAGDDFSPTPKTLVDQLVRSRAAPSAEAAQELVREAAAKKALNPDGPWSIDDFIQVCSELKAKGGLVAFVATMASSTAFLARARA